MESKIVIIGNGVVDILVHPCNESVFKNGSYHCEDISMSVGGDALNEATILSYFGKEVELISVVGDDDAGNYLLDHCRRNHIQIDNTRISQYPTAINVVLITEDGNRHFLTSNNGTLRKLYLEDIPLSFDGKIACFASIFVYPFMKDKELSTIFQYAKNKGMLTVADMTRCKNQETVDDLKETLPYIDYLIPNDEEAFLITHTNVVEEAADILYQAGVKNVIIKCGKKGCYVKNKKVAYWKPTECVEAIDTTGAGDSFVSGFIKCLSEDKSLEECISFANECGGRNVQYVGATTWTKKDE